MSPSLSLIFCKQTWGGNNQSQSQSHTHTPACLVVCLLACLLPCSRFQSAELKHVQCNIKPSPTDHAEFILNGYKVGV